MSYVVVVVITDMYKMGMVLVCVLGAAGSNISSVRWGLGRAVLEAIS